MSRPEPYSACWTLADHVDRAAALWPDNDALVFGDVRRSFEQFADATFEFARALAGLGVGAGDTVGVLLRDRHPRADRALRRRAARGDRRAAGPGAAVRAAARRRPPRRPEGADRRRQRAQDARRAAARARRPPRHGPARPRGGGPGRRGPPAPARHRGGGHRADHVRAAEPGARAARRPARPRGADPHRPDARRAALSDAARRPPVRPAAVRGARVAAAVQRLPGGRRHVRGDEGVRSGRGGRAARPRALHPRLPGGRQRLVGDPRAGARPPRAVARRRRRRAGRAEGDRGPHARGHPGLDVRHHRVRRADLPRPARRLARAAAELARPAVSRASGSRSSTPRRAPSCPPDKRAGSRSRAGHCSRATTRIPTRMSIRRGICTRPTSGRSTARAASSSETSPSSVRVART